VPYLTSFTNLRHHHLSEPCTHLIRLRFIYKTCLKAFRVFGIDKNYEENLFDENQNRDEEIELIDLTGIMENAESSTEIDYVN